MTRSVFQSILHTSGEMTQFSPWSSSTLTGITHCSPLRLQSAGGYSSVAHKSYRIASSTTTQRGEGPVRDGQWNFKNKQTETNEEKRRKKKHHKILQLAGFSRPQTHHGTVIMSYFLMNLFSNSYLVSPCCSVYQQ